MTLGEYVKQLRLQLVLQRDLSPQERGAVLPMRMMEILTEEQLIKHAALERGWTVSDEAVDAEILSHFQGEEALSPADFREQYRLMRQVTRLTDREYREIAANNIFADRLASELAASVEPVADQVRVRVILAHSRERNADVEEKLAGGADFGYLAGRLSEHPSSKDRGEYGWLARGQEDPDIEDLAFSLEPGQHGGPVMAWRGYVYVQTIVRENNRPLEPEQIEQVRQRSLSFFLSRLRKRTTVEWFWDSEKYEWAMDRVRELV